MGKVKTVTHNILGIETKFNLNCGVNGDFSTKWPQSISTVIEVERSFATLKDLEKAVEVAVLTINTQKEVFEDLIFIDMDSVQDGNAHDNVSWKLRLRFSAYRKYTSGKLVMYRRIKKVTQSGAFSGFTFLDKQDRKLYSNYLEVIGEIGEHVYVVEEKKQDKGNSCYSGELNPNFHKIKSIPFTLTNYEKMLEVQQGMQKLGERIDGFFEKAVKIGTLDFKSLQLIEAPSQNQQEESKENLVNTLTTNP